MSIVTRLAKGAPLTFAEMDGNFTTIAGLINAGFNYAVDTGSLNAIQITLATPPSLYVDGMNFSTKIANTTTSTATLQVNALGTKNIYDEYGTLLPAGLLVAGQIYTFVYNSSLNSGSGGFNTYLTNTATQPTLTTTNNPGTTVGAQLTNIGSTTGATNIGYTAPWTGAVSSTIAKKEQQVVSVWDFFTAAQIADCQSFAGTLDATSAVQAAINSLGSGGGTIFFPAGAYLISSVTVNKQCWLLGAGQFTGGTLIKPSGTNLNVFDLTTSGITMTDMDFAFAPTQTGGSFIKCDTASSIVHLEKIRMAGWWVGVLISGVSSFTLKHLRLETGVVASGVGVQVTSGVNVLLQDVICTNSSGARPLSGISIQNCGDVSIEYCQFIQCVNGLQLNPGASQVVTSVRSVNTFYDNCGNYGLFAQPSNTAGTIQRCQFTQCWFSSAGTNGILLDAATSNATIDSMEFIAPQIFLNTSHGINIGKAINTKIIGGQIAGNGGNGVLIQANTSSVDIIGVAIGPVAGITFNTTNAIQILAGTTNNLLIQGNDLRNTGGVGVISDASSGTNRRKVDNRGYNPAGTVGITVTASPFTYTAGDTPETVYVNTGTVSLITVEGVGVFSETNVAVRLGPGKPMVVTYTVAPGMSTTRD